MAELAKLTVKLVGDVNDFTSKIQSASASFQQVGSRLSSIGAGLSAGVSLPLLGIGLAAVSAASDLSESMNKATVVFGTQAAAVTAWSTTAASSFGLSRQQALETASTFGNLFDTMGIGEEASAQMSMGLVALAGDLGSFNNIDPTVALEKLRAGLVGEAEPLRTLGVNLTAATTTAKALEMGLADTAEELTQADLVTARYALIMEQTSNAQGDFARTSDGLANQMRIAKASVGDLAAKIGEALLPTALQLVTAVGSLISWLGSLPAPVISTIVVIAGLAAALGPVLMILGSIATGIGVLLPILGLLAGPLGLVALAAVALGAAFASGQLSLDSLSGALTAFQPAVTATGLVFQAMGTLVSNVWAAIQSVIGAAVGVIGGWLSAHASEIQQWLGATWTTIATIVTTAIQLIQAIVVPIIQAIGTAITAHGAEIQAVMSAAWAVISNVVTVVLAAIKGLITATLAIIHGDWSGAWEAIKTATSTILTALGAMIQSLLAALQAFVTGWLDTHIAGWRENWTAIRTFVETTIAAVSSVVQAVMTAMQGVIAAIHLALQGDFSGAWTTIKTTVTTLVNALKEVVATQFNLLKTIIINRVTEIKDNAANLFAALKAAVVNRVTEIKDNAANLFAALKAAVVNRITETRDSLATLFAAIKTAVVSRITETRDSLATLFAAIKTAVVNRITEMKTGVITLFQQLKDKVVEKFTMMRDEVLTLALTWITSMIQAGRDLIQGMIDGVGRMANALVTAITDLVNAAIDAVLAALGLGSPSRVFRYFGEMTMAGFVVGVRASGKAVVKSVEDVFGQVTKIGAPSLALAPAGIGTAGAMMGGTTMPSRSAGQAVTNYHITVNNPVRETAENSIRRELLYLSAGLV